MKKLKKKNDPRTRPIPLFAHSKKTCSNNREQRETARQKTVKAKQFPAYERGCAIRSRLRKPSRRGMRPPRGASRRYRLCFGPGRRRTVVGVPGAGVGGATRAHAPRSAPRHLARRSTQFRSKMDDSVRPRADAGRSDCPATFGPERADVLMMFQF